MYLFLWEEAGGFLEASAIPALRCVSRQFRGLQCPSFTPKYTIRWRLLMSIRGSLNGLQELDVRCPFNCQGPAVWPMTLRRLTLRGDLRNFTGTLPSGLRCLQLDECCFRGDLPACQEVRLYDCVWEEGAWPSATPWTVYRLSWYRSPSSTATVRPALVQRVLENCSQTLRHLDLLVPVVGRELPHEENRFWPTLPELRRLKTNDPIIMGLSVFGSQLFPRLERLDSWYPMHHHFSQTEARAYVGSYNVNLRLVTFARVHNCALRLSFS